MLLCLLCCEQQNNSTQIHFISVYESLLHYIILLVYTGSLQKTLQQMLNRYVFSYI